jgi:hypothetical protein
MKFILKKEIKKFFLLIVVIFLMIILIGCGSDEEKHSLIPFRTINDWGKTVWGYSNTNGRIIIDPIYEEVENFSKGVARVRLNRKWGFIDTEGTQYWDD